MRCTCHTVREQRGLVGANELARMKSTARLVNTSRGAISDAAALIKALRNNELAGAALDVFDKEPLPEDREGKTMTLKVYALDHLVLNVLDVEVSAAWYARALGMTREDSPAVTGKAARTSMQFGVQKINLRPISASKSDWFTADREAAGSDDICFLTQSAPQAVVQHLESCGIAVEKGPVQKRGARGMLMSVYCRDPDGSLIEIASYTD